MATRSYSLIPTQTSKATVARWTGLAPNDDGDPLPHSQYSDKSVQVVGTFGGATVAIQGSNDGANWSVLTDPQGNALTFTSAGIEMVTEATAFLRPLVNGGAGTDLSVFVLCKE